MYLLNAGEISWAQRPRLWWVTWKWQFRGPERELEVTTKIPGIAHDATQITHWGKRPNVPWGRPWETKGSPSMGLPTLTRPQSGTEPVWRDRGLDRADDATVERWKQDHCKYQVYQYEEKSQREPNS